MNAGLAVFWLFDRSTYPCELLAGPAPMTAACGRETECCTCKCNPHEEDRDQALISVRGNSTTPLSRLDGIYARIAPISL